MNVRIKKIISIATILFLVLMTLFFAYIESEHLNHIDCEEEHCPVCEMIYVVKKCTSNISDSKTIFLTFLLSIVYLNKCYIDNKNHSKYKTLIEYKVRLDC